MMMLLRVIAFLTALSCKFISLNCVKASVEETYPGLFAADAAGGRLRSLLLVVSKDGLANRLRTIADMYAMARKAERELVISWEPQVDCNVTFADLFDVGATQAELPGFRSLPFTIADPAESGSETEQLLRAAAATRGLSLSMLPHIPDFFLSSSSVMFSRQVDVVVSTYSGLSVLDGVPCSEYLQARASFLSALVPVPFVAQHVQSVLQTFFEARTLVGVHHRVQDSRFDWAVVPPMLDSTGSAVEFTEGASLDDFVENMHDILLANPEVRFFFASNDASAKEQILRIFGDKVVILRGPQSRSDAQGMRFALVEWLVLSHSTLLLNTYGSSFGQEAAQVRGAALVGIWHHHHKVFSRDERLRFCGIPDYMKKYTNEGVRKTYTEGTIDSRVIDDEYFTLDACPWLARWGLSGVYCAQ